MAAGLDSYGLEKGQLETSCKSGNEKSCSKICGEFIQYLRTGSFSRRILLQGVSKSVLTKRVIQCSEKNYE